MQSYVLVLLGVLIIGIAGVAYYTYTTTRSLGERVDTCTEDIVKLKAKLQGIESIFTKPPMEELSPMFNLTQQPIPFGQLEPIWREQPTVKITEEANTPPQADPWSSAASDDSNTDSEADNEAGSEAASGNSTTPT